MASAERRDGKLESFLKKYLHGADYGRLLAKQPCVAVLENEKPSHRHAVVGHCRVFLTDVPPKSLKMTLQLRDVESIKIVRRLDSTPTPLQSNVSMYISTCTCSSTNLQSSCKGRKKMKLFMYKSALKEWPSVKVRILGGHSVTFPQH